MDEKHLFIIIGKEEDRINNLLSEGWKIKQVIPRPLIAQGDWSIHHYPKGEFGIWLYREISTDSHE